MLIYDCQVNKKTCFSLQLLYSIFLLPVKAAFKFSFSPSLLSSLSLSHYIGWLNLPSITSFFLQSFLYKNREISWHVFHDEMKSCIKFWVLIILWNILPWIVFLPFLLVSILIFHNHNFHSFTLLHYILNRRTII